MRPTTNESREQLMRAVGVPQLEPLPQEADREPPSDAAVFMAKVVLACIALFVFVLCVIALGHLLTEARPL